MKNIILIFIFLVSVFTSNAQKFGIIDMKMVITSANTVKTIQVQSDSSQAALKAKLDVKVADYNDKAKIAQDKKSNGDVSPNAEKMLLDELKKLNDEIIKFEQQEYFNINEVQNKKMEIFIEVMKSATKKIAKTNNVDVVFDSNQVIWINGKDLTQELIKELNK